MPGRLLSIQELAERERSFKVDALNSLHVNGPAFMGSYQRQLPVSTKIFP